MAIRFDSNADRLTSAVAPVHTALTVSLFVRFRGPNGRVPSDQIVFSIENNDSSNYISIQTSDAGTDGLLTINTGQAPFVEGFLPLVVDQWYFVAFTSDGTTLTAYAKKLKDVSLTSGTTNISGFSPPFVTDKFFVGGAEAFSTKPPTCDLFGVRIWSAVLNSTEVNTEAGSPDPVRTSNLYANYREKKLAHKLVDFSGQAHHLTASDVTGTWQVYPDPFTVQVDGNGRMGLEYSHLGVQAGGAVLDQLGLGILDEGDDYPRNVNAQLQDASGRLMLQDGTSTLLFEGVPSGGNHLLLENGSALLNEAAVYGTSGVGSIPITGTAANLLEAHKLFAASGAIPITGTAASLHKVFTLNAAAGAIPITGTAANLLEQRKLLAASGSIPITGTAARLLEQHDLFDVPGSVPITGTAANLLEQRKLLAASGSIPITGTAANLLEAHKLLAASGSIPITGTAATLHKGYALVAASGSIPITGTAANLLEQRKLLAASGSIPITGTAANLLEQRKLLAASGSIPITGTAARLLEQHDLFDVPGSVPITGTPATLTKGIALIAGAGAVPITGTSATLLTTRKLQAGAGAVALTGTPASLRVAYRVLAGAGAVPITGTDATFTIGRSGIVMDAAPGSAPLTGTDASLLWNRALLAASGNIPVHGQFGVSFSAAFGTQPSQAVNSDDRSKTNSDDRSQTNASSGRSYV